MDKIEKRDFWKKHLADWSSSGLSQKAYCEQHDLKLATFSYWRKQLSASPRPRSKLIPVSLPSPSRVIRISAAGLQLDVPVDVLEQVLPVVWRSLKAAP